jgi:hypothetical protein
MAVSQHVAEQQPALAGVGELLGQSVQCPDLSVTLGGFSGCDTSCVEQLCIAGLDSMWMAALEVSAQQGLVGTVTLQASGAASFDDRATLTGFEGSWLGSITNGLLDAKVQGVVSAREAQQSPAQ